VEMGGAEVVEGPALGLPLAEPETLGERGSLPFGPSALPCVLCSNDAKVTVSSFLPPDGARDVDDLLEPGIPRCPLSLSIF